MDTTLSDASDYDQTVHAVRLHTTFSGLVFCDQSQFLLCGFFFFQRFSQQTRGLLISQLDRQRMQGPVGGDFIVLHFLRCRVLRAYAQLHECRITITGLVGIKRRRADKNGNVVAELPVLTQLFGYALDIGADGLMRCAI